MSDIVQEELSHYKTIPVERQWEGYAERGLWSLARTGNLDPELLVRAQADGFADAEDPSQLDPWVSALAQNPSLTETFMEVLLETKNSLTLCGLAHNVALPARLQVRLAEEDEYVQGHLAVNRSLSPEAAHILASKSPIVQHSLACNDRIPLAVAEKLMWSEDESILLAVSINPALDGVGMRPKDPVRFHEYSETGRDEVMALVVAAGGDVEVATSLLSSWGGSVADLIVASLLVR